MVEKRMTQPNSCEGCSQAHDCEKVYEQLGGSEGPPVTRKVLVAFLLPIVVFVAALGGFGWLLQGAVGQRVQTPAALVLALATTAGMMLAVRSVARHHRKN
jgi:hypothetical protein